MRLVKYRPYTVVLSAMAIDPRHFSKAAVSDTCSVWNVLSSLTLFRASLGAGAHFCITPMVLYECQYKPRKHMNDAKIEMMKRLNEAREGGAFPIQACDLDDLATLVLQAPKGLGSGELSCIAAAYRIRSIAFMTDEKQARHFASNGLGRNVETTPKLYAWLHYHQHLTDVDHHDIVREHELYESRPLTSFFTEAYGEALRCRLMDRSTPSAE
ncbi:hypothetical protein ACW73L_18160 [Methylolobus aquaticus]